MILDSKLISLIDLFNYLFLFHLYNFLKLSLKAKSKVLEVNIEIYSSSNLSYQSNLTNF